MNMQLNEPAAPAGGPAPAAILLPAGRSTFARIADTVEGIVYWGILAFGLLFPMGGALYAWLR